MKLTDIEKEFYFGEFIKSAAFEINNPKEANVVFERMSDGNIVLYFYFYEKKLSKKYKDTIVVTITPKGKIVFAGKMTNESKFSRQQPLRFLKYQIANAVDQFLKNETAYSEVVLEQYYR